MSANFDPAGCTDAFSTVEAAETAWVTQRRVAAEIPVDAETVGLAFSGGGIRSATFNLGVLEALDAAGMMRHVDYLSSVSGGGYIAACYSWLRALLPASTPRLFESPLHDGGKVVDWLRRHGRYLVAARGYSMSTLMASILAATFLNLLVLGPVIVLAVYGMTLGWLPLTWPDWLAVPDVGQIRDHHGYLLLLGAGVASLVSFPLTAIAFALVAGRRELSPMRLVDSLRVLMGRQIGIGVALLAVGLIPVVHTFGELLATRFESALMHALSQHLVYLTPVVSGVAALLTGTRGLSPWRRQLAMLGLALIVYGLLVYAYHLAEHVGIVRTPWFAGVIALSLLLAFVCNINSISMNAYYRARLSESFMPPVVGAEAIPPAQFKLDQIDPRTGAPFHLVNTTLNTTSSPDEKNRSREGASFFFSPLYCGSTATGFGSPTDYSAGTMALSTAFTISGAAIDPNTYVTSSRAVSSLLALLNVRLGYWAENPARRSRAHWPLPWWWILIGREMLGVGLDERHARIHLSDGGHFENLGLYELVRRQVRHIVVCDAGADPELLLADLGRAIERVRVDFGAEIALSADALVSERASGHARRPYLLGDVRYADGSHGQILYIKPMLIESASADLYAYARANPDFPNQSTANQFFCESEFEAYRVLGREIVGRMLGSTPPADIAQWFEQLRQTSTSRAA